MTPAPTMVETLKPTMFDIQECLPRKTYPAPLTENERKAIMKKQKRYNWTRTHNHLQSNKSAIKKRSNLNLNLRNERAEEDTKTF